MEFAELNPAQREAVENLSDNILLLAPAGTGKTNTLACRIANILAAERAEPEEILCLTFTNKACREMKERIVLRAGEAGRRGGGAGGKAGGQTPGGGAVWHAGRPAPASRELTFLRTSRYPQPEWRQCLFCQCKGIRLCAINGIRRDFSCPLASGGVY